MSGVSSYGVSNFSNTTLAYVQGVVADGVVSGTGVVCMYADVPPEVFDYLITQDNRILDTQSGDRIYVDIILNAPLLSTQAGDILNTQDLEQIIT